MAKRDYYEVLGISKTSSSDEIKKAYRHFLLTAHPDKVKGNDAYFADMHKKWLNLL